MDTVDLNNLRDSQDSNEPPAPGTVDKPKGFPEDLKPTSKGVENAKKRLRAFSIQKKSSLSPVSLPKTITTTVGSVGTVFIGKLASSKPALKPGDIEEAVDPKKPPKPPKPGTSKLQNADYLNIQKKTLSEIEAMKRKMELVDLGIPLGLICPAPNSDKAMPTKAMPPIKSMLLDPAKVDEIIREAKKAKAEGKTFKFSYEKLLPSYQNPFQKKDKDKDRDQPPPLNDDHRQSRDRRKYSENFRRYSGHKDEKRRDWHREAKEKMRANIIRNRESREQRAKLSKEKLKDVKVKEKDVKSKEKDVKTKEKSSTSKKVDTIHLTDEDDHAVKGVLHEASEKTSKEADVNLKDFVVCDSWSENEEKKDPTPNKNDKNVISAELIEQHKSGLTSEEPATEIKVEKLRPVTDSFKFEIEDDHDDEETLDMFAECPPTVKKYAKQITIPVARKKELYDSPVPMRFDYDASIDPLDESFLESVIAEIKQEDIDDDDTQDKALVEYDSPKDERESITPELDDKIREMYSRSEYSDGFKSVDSLKSNESGFKSSESGYKSTESRAKTDDSLKSAEAHKDENRSPNRPKSTEDHTSKESGYKLTRSETPLGAESPAADVMSKSTADSLETWSFVMKICQPLLFRHDKNKCYKETKCTPKIWFTENPKICDCVKDRTVVYEELEMCKMELVDNVYGSEQVQEAIYPEARGWYPAAFLAESGSVALSSEWEAEDSQERPTPPPHTRDEMVLDREYQKFMQAVWPEVEGAIKSETPRTTPVRDVKKRPGEEPEAVKKKKVKLSEGKLASEGGKLASDGGKLASDGGKMASEGGKLSSEGWSQESEVEEDIEKNKKQKMDKIKRKRKHSTSMSTSDGESPNKKKKKIHKKEKKEKSKNKVGKRQRLSKKYLKKLKEKQLKKKKKLSKLESDGEEPEKEKKKKEKKIKKKKLLKHKKKTQKRKSKKSSSSSSSDSESDRKSKKKEMKKKHKKRKQSSSDSNQPEELFDVNILKNIKTERLTDDEKKNFTPNKKHREIINVKQLQNDFVSFQIKKEIEDVNSPDEFEESFTEDEKKQIEKQKAEKESEKRELDRIELDRIELERIDLEKKELEKKELEKKELEKLELEKKELEKKIEVEKAMVIDVADIELPLEEKDKHEFKEPEYTRPLTPQRPQPEENLSQSSSQESIVSNKPYEKDDSHLRPSSQNSNYNFHDVMRNEGHTGQGPCETELYVKGAEMDIEGDYEQGNYEMYEQMAMEYQSDVASQRVAPPDSQTSGRIETVVRSRTRGEIKCDWRPGDDALPNPPAAPRPSRWGDPRDSASTNATPQRPSRWGLKPNEVNIVLTGGTEAEPSEFHGQSIAEPAVYKIQSLANRTDNSNSGYDEAYMDMYGASDRLQYGDCFSREAVIKEVEKQAPKHHSSLDDRIDLALRTTILGDVAKDETQEEEEGRPDRGILVTKLLVETRNVKRVSFADGYKPGQDSDTEEPPVIKKKKVRRTGCPWPCPATHRDHVSLWDALPPPPPPPGSPPPPPAALPPPAHLLRSLRARPSLMQTQHPMTKFDPNTMGAFMPPEPPPGLISF